MRVHLLYFTGCPHWELAEARLGRAIEILHLPVEVEHVLVTTWEEAEHWGFRGSPSVLVDGLDPFNQPAVPVGLSCRMYPTPDGIEGAPTVDQLIGALRSAAGTGDSFR